MQVLIAALLCGIGTLLGSAESSASLRVRKLANASALLATQNLYSAELHEIEGRAALSADPLLAGMRALTGYSGGIAWLDPSPVSLENERQATVVNRMLETIKEAQEMDTTDMEKEARLWGKSQAENEVVGLSGSFVEKAWVEEKKAEELRKESTKYTQAAMLVAAKMVQVAREAKQVAEDMARDNATAVIESVDAENQVALSQAKQSIQMSVMAKQMVEQADRLARSALSRAMSAEASAMQALSTARRNTRRIAKLKARVQAALQKAKAAH